MERELEKTLLEIECSIKDHERRGNTHTQSVLEQARDIIGMCAQAARTPSALKEILERATTGGWVPVEERLPEEKINPVSQDFYEYQVTAKFENVKDVRHYKYGNGHWWNGPGIVDQYVIAWRPSPEPYRPKNKTEETDWRQDMLRKFDRRD